ncbi:SGNH/GDSL hydrolase family protein [Mycobacterium sp. pV006]|uniref:SGNH/GDSL hydrolase family protein n=1 Tax=Mycobacterium sp. pV006 TaxID=3238983 RepID=UPI00351BAB84
MKKSGQVLTVVLLVSAVVALLIFGLARVAPGHNDDATARPALAETLLAPTPPSEQFDHRPTLLVVGDSYVGGTGDPTVVVYPEQVADEMGWNVRIDAVGGSGYVSNVTESGRKRPSLIERLPADKASYTPDIVLVDAGRNDLALDPAAVVPEIDRYLTEVRAAWPDAQIVVVKPQFASAAVPANYPPLANAIDEIATRIGAATIDPVTEGWWTGIDLEPLLFADKVHLNGAGTTYYADKIAEALNKISIASIESPGGN